MLKTIFSVTILAIFAALKPLVVFAGGDQLKRKYEMEVGLNTDKSTAKKVIDHFGLKLKAREDLYINLYEKGEFKLTSKVFRLKHHKSKGKIELQIYQRLLSSTAKCGGYDLKITQKRKFDVKLKREKSRPLTNKFRQTQAEIVSIPHSSPDFKGFARRIVEQDHPAYPLLEEEVTEASVWVPVKRTSHKKYSKYLDTKLGEIKITVGWSSDYIHDELIEDRFDLEFSTDDDTIPAISFSELACSLLLDSRTPKLIQLPSSRKAVSKTRMYLDQL